MTNMNWSCCDTCCTASTKLGIQVCSYWAKGSMKRRPLYHFIQLNVVQLRSFVCAGADVSRLFMNKSKSFLNFDGLVSLECSPCYDALVFFKSIDDEIGFIPFDKLNRKFTLQISPYLVGSLCNAKSRLKPGVFSKIGATEVSYLVMTPSWYGLEPKTIKIPTFWAIRGRFMPCAFASNIVRLNRSFSSQTSIKLHHHTHLRSQSGIHLMP